MTVRVPNNKACSLCFTNCWAFPLETTLWAVGDGSSEYESVVVATFSEKKDDGVLAEGTVERSALVVDKPCVPEDEPEPEYDYPVRSHYSDLYSLEERVEMLEGTYGTGYESLYSLEERIEMLEGTYGTDHESLYSLEERVEMLEGNTLIGGRGRKKTE